MTLVGDLIELPLVRTVVKLSDLEDDSLRDNIRDSFILTGEVKENFSVLFAGLLKNKGQGFFLQGSYGSGKSHFLSVLCLAASDSSSHSLFTFNDKLLSLASSVYEKNLLVLNLSLVDYSSKESLEDIISYSLWDRLKFHKDLTGRYREDMISLITSRYSENLESFLKEKNISREEFFSGKDNSAILEELLETLDIPYRFKYSRKDIFEKLGKSVLEEGYGGVLLLIDELSEFLRSKPDARKFNEDIRFLQYLGEISQENPLWTVAGLQERIEETGEISPYVFNKIKDRYPVRLLLTGKHIEDLIRDRLIVKKPSSFDSLKSLYRKFKTSFSFWPVSEKQFISLYPVHPETVSLLDNLKFLFSQHRGVVDFIHYQIKGDERRDIKGILEEAYNTILTPERIFDHFRLRIKETIELNPYHDIVYRYYEQEIKNLFPDEEDGEVAFRLIKLLILTSMMPLKKRYSVKNLAECLLERITDLESGINYRYFNDILEKLHRDGSYIGFIKSSEEFKDVYFIDIEADLNLVIKRKTEYIMNSFFPEDSRIYEENMGSLDDPGLPLGHFAIDSINIRTVTWQNTARRGFIILINLLKVTEEKIRELEEKLLYTETDFVLFIATPHLIERQKEYIRNVLMPVIKEKRGDAFLFWLPEKVEDEEPLKQGLSYMLLLEEISAGSTEKLSGLKDTVEALLEENRKEIKEIFLDVYRKGEFLFPSHMESERERDVFSFNRTIDARIFTSLDNLYPKHINISPFSPVLTRNKIRDIIEYFFRTGSLVKEKDYGLRMAIEGFLQPLKVIRKTPQGFELNISPKRSEPVSAFLSLMTEERTKVEDIYLAMRKGPLGICSLQFELLTCALIFSGMITPVKENRKIPLNQIRGNNFNQITHVTPGQLISPFIQSVIKNIPFLPQKFAREDFNYSLQQEMWKVLCREKKSLEEEIEKVSLEINKVMSYEGLSSFQWNKIRGDLSRVKEVLEEIKTSYSSADGLERLALKLRDVPYFDEIYERVNNIKIFFLEYTDRYLFIYHYINYPAFVIPEERKYNQLSLEKDMVNNHLLETEKVFSLNYMRDLEEKFARFLTLYQTLYQGEHRNALAEERFKTFEHIKDSEGYRWLKKLSSISFVSVKNDRVKVDRYIAKALEKRCSFFDPGTLRRKPFCNCNFHLGIIPELPSLQEIEEIISAGIKEYILSLREERYRELLLYTIKGLEEIGDRKKASSIRYLLEFELKDSSLYKNLKEHLSPGVIEAVNQTLSGRVVLVTRNMDDLYDNLLDRSFPRDKLLEIFFEWLDRGEKADPKVYVKVISRSNPFRDTPLKTEVDEKYPELMPLYREGGEENFNCLLWSARWLKDHSLEKENIRELFEEYGEQLERDFDSLCEMADFILTEQPKEALSLIREGEGTLMDKKMESLLWNVLEERRDNKKLSNIASIIKKERLFSFILKRASSLLFKILQDKPGLVKNQEILNVYDCLKSETELMAKEDVRTCRIFFSIHKSLDSLDRWQPDRVKTYLNWEKVFTSYLAYMPYWLSSLASNLNRTSLLKEPAFNNLKGKVKNITGSYDKVFKDFYIKNYPSWRNGEKPRPYFIHNIVPEVFPYYKKALKAEHSEFFLLDAMRWDLWGYIKRKVISSIPQIRVVKEIPLWAHPPTVTSVQMDGFYSSSWPAGVTLKNDFLAGENFDLESEKIEEKSIGEERLIKYNLIDNKLHVSPDDMVTLYREINLRLETYLSVYFDSLPAKSMVLLFSDHGFKENTGFPDKKKRYSHGGLSLWEVMVPLVILYKL